MAVNDHLCPLFFTSIDKYGVASLDQRSSLQSPLSSVTSYAHASESSDQNRPPWLGRQSIGKTVCVKSADGSRKRPRQENANDSFFTGTPSATCRAPQTRGAISFRAKRYSTRALSKLAARRCLERARNTIDYHGTIIHKGNTLQREENRIRM